MVIQGDKNVCLRCGNTIPRIIDIVLLPRLLLRYCSTHHQASFGITDCCEYPSTACIIVLRNQCAKLGGRCGGQAREKPHHKAPDHTRNSVGCRPQSTETLGPCDRSPITRIVLSYIY